MKISSVVLLSLCTISFGCEPKYPLKIEDSQAIGVIVGREKCNSNDSLNAWLINLTPIGNGRVLGSSATINNKTYDHVVKTLKITQTDTTKKYYIEYDSKSSNINDCNIANPITYPVPYIRINLMLENI